MIYYAKLMTGDYNNEKKSKEHFNYNVNYSIQRTALIYSSIKRLYYS